MIYLDGNKFKSRDEVFSYLNEKIDFEYEVNNLDGLFDELSMLDEKIVIKNYSLIYKNLNDYGEKFLSYEGMSLFWFGNWFSIID